MTTIVYPNHTALMNAVKLYEEGMRRFVKERLVAAFNNQWWDKGVVAALKDHQRTDLLKDVESYPDREKIELLSPSRLMWVVLSNYDAVFKQTFGERNSAQNKMNAAQLARNQRSHSGTGDILPEEAAHPMYDMVQLLLAAGQPEAATIDALRKDVLKIEAAPAPAPTAGAQPAPAGALPYWWQLCEPNDAFQNPAAVDESLFAATLGGVHAGAARAEFRDPKLFFAHTYFTANLKQIVQDVASRLTGGDGPAVTEMQTPFGGGKTHALLTVYHLVRDPATCLAVPGVREALGEVSIPPDAKVVVFDGNEWGTEPIDKGDGCFVQTLWGELAHQADPGLFVDLLRESDGRGEAPGNAVYRQVLQRAAPCLILIDELVSYLVKLKFTTARRSQNLYRQTVQFVQELLQEAGNVPGVCVLISLPKSRREFGGIDPQELQMQLGILDELQARADRVVTKRTPVNDDEIYTLMSRRLFKPLDTAAAERVARAYRELYQANPALYDDTVLSPDYLEHQIAAYPLHPELIDVLYKKWSTASDFPRTRAVLQLLASIVADEWTHRRPAHAIQSGHVNLDRDRVRTRIVSAAGAEFDGIVKADIIGGDAHADAMDHRLGGEYERFGIARGVATTILMHSFGGAERVGALPWEVRLGSVAPNLEHQYLTDVLGSLEQTLWYVHREGERLRFQNKVNVYRVIATRAEEQPESTVTQRIKEAVIAAKGSPAGFQQPIEWAGSDGTIVDRPEPTVAILDPRYAVEQVNGSGVVGREPIDRLWDRVGGGLRTWRNALILVAPDRELWGAALAATREVLAYEAVIAQAKRKAIEVTEHDLKDLESRVKERQDSLRTSVTTAYRWVFFPDASGLEVVSLTVPATSNERIAERAVARLASQDYSHPKVLEKMGAAYFQSRFVPQLWKDDGLPLNLRVLRQRFSEWTYLPILVNRDAALRACVRDGIANGLWAVAIGDDDSVIYQRLVERPEELDALVDPYDGTASLVRGQYLAMVREQVRPAETPPVEPPPPTAGGDGSDAWTSGDGGGSKGVVADGKPTPAPAAIPTPKRYSRVRIKLAELPVAKTTNLQPYLFKLLQGQDPGAELTITIEVRSNAGIAEQTLNGNIVEGLEQLGIEVTWEPA